MNTFYKLVVVLTTVCFFSAGITSTIAHTTEHQSMTSVSQTGTLVPDLVYSPTSHDFGNVAQGQTYQTTFQIWNGGTGTLTWNLGIVHTWISPSPPSGDSTGPGDKDTITVTIDTTGLTLGTHSGFVSISANDGGGTRYFNIDCTVVANNPPNTPSPLTGPTTVNEGISYTYSTSTTDPDGDDVKYGIDFDNDDIIEPGHWTPLISSGSTMNINIVFTGVGTRYLRVKAEDEHGMQSGFSSALTVNVVSGSNNAPTTPSTPTGPTTGSTGTSYTYSTVATDSDGDQIRYGFDWDGDDSVDEWTGLYNSGDTVSQDYTWLSAGTYQVKVKAKDEHDAESAWSTALTVTISGSNTAPSIPSTPSGPTSGNINMPYTYTTSTTDPEDDDVYYLFDWGDGTDSGWIGPSSSGDPVQVTHTWTTQGSYDIRVRAKDTEGLLSPWSDPLSISMPKGKSFHGLDQIISILQKLFAPSIE